MDKEMVAGAGGEGSLLDTLVGAGEGWPPAPSTPPSCEGPQRKAQGLGWPPGSRPNPLLMSGQPEGLSPWPQPCKPGAPARPSGGQGSPKAFVGTFLPAQHPTSHIPQCQAPSISRDTPG